MSRDLSTAAQHYASQGWHVFPLAPGEKTPAVKNWPTKATTNPHTINQWWPPNRPERLGLAIATGPSHLVIIDCDLKTDEDGQPISGIENLANLETDNTPIGPTRTVTTPTGGRHYYFTAPPNHTIRNSAGKLAQAVDIRATGGYIITPPTTTKTGTYTLTNPTPPRPLPNWITQTLTTPTTPNPTPEHILQLPTWAINPYIAAALRGETHRIHSAPPGQRNHTLYQAAANLGELIAAGYLNEHQATHTLTDAYQHHITNGADTPEQAARTIQNGINRGKQNPRNITPQPPTPATRPTTRPSATNIHNTTRNQTQTQRPRNAREPPPPPPKRHTVPTRKPTP